MRSLSLSCRKVTEWEVLVLQALVIARQPTAQSGGHLGSRSAALTQEYGTAFRDGGTAVSLFHGIPMPDFNSAF